VPVKSQEQKVDVRSQVVGLALLEDFGAQALETRRDRRRAKTYLFIVEL
jgi:hypothetical protein